MAIKFILCFNKQGIVRLVRWFELSANEAQKTQDVIVQIYRLISSRDHKHQSNFVEFSDSTKLVYKRYAGLFFVMGVGLQDEEPIYLSHIHLFVEVLDAFFGNVCELDIVFNFYKAYMVMDEMFIGGEIQEISKDMLLERLSTMDRLD
ncbi:APS2 (YJR058C) [Zygosaccharomyces parabailii]|uniref:AP complex subunit sigma n=1 Tax=Zygosaccharomyces bailii (strain CLIB 213 / ATCC 58445 / CBS 680 / BCRC 21525 / NBRC 1098 / NCYC 1416 / NRRL Y-2227) TaxID=1333698 RepID=A0A8J2T543_ZYGB2|nr:APS2 (YJR058C) [Zygosaccharomyces parabailii]AQZ16952.1 APS2 (YJR058C) [Zygosaccharomyces parabailii]CDF88668.1 BN860_15654g1_1 [Zygosaccharomyces bailii CLIB 213]CDH09171.1 AP-2 complex subunit sigma [Zygosaccharomyces bailii ISA1307]SJM82512.1 AP-2 complex subunit sigma [Zygosaccharomyces bailii]